MTARIMVGDAIEQLRLLADASVHMCATSPPYYGKRDYGIPPSVWGGDPACAHRWGDELLDRSKRSPGTQCGSLTGDGRYQVKACRFEIRSNFCADCGAWRGCLGLEPTPELYVEHMVLVFEEVRRVLRPDGTLWLNLGDSYATGAGRVGEHPGGGEQGKAWAGTPNPGATSWAGVRGKKVRATRDGSHAGINTAMAARGPMTQPNRMPLPGLKPKDLIGIPWMVAFALRRAGWWLRGENIWSKPNPMPESVTDRCTVSHETVFLLAKSEQYYFDADAIAEESVEMTRPQSEKRRLQRMNRGVSAVAGGGQSSKGIDGGEAVETHVMMGGAYRNKRTVWTISTKPFPGAHFATFPPELVEPCILAGTSGRGCCVECAAGWERQADFDGKTIGWWPGCRCEALGDLVAYPPRPKTKDADALREWEIVCRQADRVNAERCAEHKARPTAPAVVIDPFGGAFTTAMVACRLQRSSIMIERNEEYAEMGNARISADAGMFARVAE